MRQRKSKYREIINDITESSKEIQRTYKKEINSKFNKKKQLISEKPSYTEIFWNKIRNIYLK